MKHSCHCADWTPLIMRLIMGVTFLFTGIGKFLGGVENFVEYVNTIGVLPENLGTIYGNALPYVEVVLGGLLVLGIFTRFAAWVSALIIASFIIDVGLANIDTVTFLLQPPMGGMPNKDFAYLAMMVSVGLMGSGVLAVDNLWGNKEE